MRGEHHYHKFLPRDTLITARGIRYTLQRTDATAAQRSRHETQVFLADASDHSRIFVNPWLPDPPLKGVMMLAHGMAEHSGRYARLGRKRCASRLCLVCP